MYADDTRGQNQGGSSQSAVGYDVLKSRQHNPVSAGQNFMPYDPVFAPSTNAKQVGAVASDQMDHRTTNANYNAESQQQGLGANAQGRTCVNQHDYSL